MKTPSIARLTALFVLLGFLLAPLYSTAQDGKTAFLAKDNLVPVLGSGKVKVRFYTDYFCGPCRALEPKIEPLIADLVKRNAITITFIDAPFHTYSSLYAKYFLFIYRDRREPEYLLKARNILFEAAKQQKDGNPVINNPPALEEYLSKNYLRFQPYDPAAVFAVLAGYIQEDKINQTPSCVITDGGKKETYRGGADIIKALSAIK
ncbi:MAG TPA: thioredoxin domain-containing protein [Syntrophorhabdaceae bacterium]